MARQPKTLTGQIRDLCNRAERLNHNRRFPTGSGDQALWQILTALRGPDDMDDSLKERTTARVRAFVTPAAHPYATVSLAIPPEVGYGHFGAHVNAAVGAMKWLRYMRAGQQ